MVFYICREENELQEAAGFVPCVHQVIFTYNNFPKSFKGFYKYHIAGRGRFQFSKAQISKVKPFGFILSKIR